MSKHLHNLAFQNQLRENRPFLKSLLSQQLSKRKLIIQKASNKELRLLQKLLTFFVRGEIGVTSQFLKKLKTAKKLSFIEENFDKIRVNTELRNQLLKLVPILNLFAKVTLKKNGTKQK